MYTDSPTVSVVHSGCLILSGDRVSLVGCTIMLAGNLHDGQRPQQSDEGTVEGECHLLFVPTAPEKPVEQGLG